MFTLACATPSAMLVNNQGQTVRCATSGWGWAGAPMASSAFDRCVEDYKTMGYLDVSVAGYVGIQFDKDEKKMAKIILVQPGSPAEKAGLKVDDVIVSVGAQPVTSPAVGKQLVFGKAGESVDLKVKHGKKISEYKLTREVLPSVMKAQNE